MLAAALLLIGLLALAARVSSPDDGSAVADWSAGGVTVDVPAGNTAGDGQAAQLQTGDVVISIAGSRLADGLGRVSSAAVGDRLDYGIDRDAASKALDLTLGAGEVLPLFAEGWGNLVFVCSLAALATALYLRRPQEPATTPLLIAGAGLLGSTLAFTADIPAIAVAAAGPLFWLYLLNVLVVYSVSWGAVVAFAIQLSGLRRQPRARGPAWAYVGGPALFAVWIAVAGVLAINGLDWIRLAFLGQTVLVVATLTMTGTLAIVAYVRSPDPLARDRLRWLVIGGAGSVVLALAGWHLPDLILGHQLLPSAALGLSGLPFVAGIAIALRRHRLFDIEHLANRSLVNVTLIAVLAGGYAAIVALLVSWLGISGPVAAAVAAAAAALALAPLRTIAQRWVNHLMYGDRDDPSALLARLGTRMQAAMLPDDVPPAVVETVAQSLRLPYVAIDIADGAGRFRVAAEHGERKGGLHSEPLSHHGATVGRLRVSDRGTDDPLDQADLALIRSLAREVGPAVEAVRLHRDLLQSRAEAVALREDERRRLRRDLHDGLGPTLAAIRLKAALAARDLPSTSPALGMLGEIENEAAASLVDIRRLVEALRPPALDELGLLGALRSRAASLAGDLTIDVTGTTGETALPAAAETAAYRIAVEAMTNTVRHSGARHCVIDVAADQTTVRVVVRDDGHGLPSTRTPGVGLRSMQERAAEVGGGLTIESSTGGTTVSARLPLDLGVPT